MDFAGGTLPPVEQAIFDAGERINEAVAGLLRAGDGERRRSGATWSAPTVFALWAAFSGLIRMAADKQAYIETGDGAFQAGVPGLWISEHCTGPSPRTRRERRTLNGR